MRIKHVSILNLDNFGINKSTKTSNLYSMRVYLSANPDQAWKEHFYTQWRKIFFYKNKRLDFSQSEMRVYLEKGDDIQKYIESIKRLVERTNKLVILDQRRRKTEYRRRLRISNLCGAKTYKII